MKISRVYKKSIIRFITIALAVMLSVNLAVPSAFAGPTMSDYQASYNFMQSLGVVHGYPDGQAHLDDTLTRAQAVTILVNAFGQQANAKLLQGAAAFPDTATGWYSGAVAVAHNAGWANGMPDGMFHPNDKVTYAELIQMLDNALGLVVNRALGWPAGPIQAAVDAGFLPANSDLAAIANSYATRGAAFYFSNKAFMKPLMNGKNVYQTYVDTTSPSIFIDSVQTPTQEQSITISGNVNGAMSVTVNGIAANLNTDGSSNAYGSFSAVISLQDGDNKIKVIATNMVGTTSEKDVLVTKAAPPTITLNTVPASTQAHSVTISGTVKDANGLTVNGQTVSLKADGSFSTIISLQIGSNKIKVIATSITGTTNEKDVTVIRKNPPVSVLPPTANPASGAVASGTTVSLSDGTPGATIFYTIDGTTPTVTNVTSWLYGTYPITITTNTTVKAIAVKSGMSNSAVMSESYTIKQPVATPTANPASGAVASGTTVSLSDGTSGATIYYTTDGTTPTVTSAVYGTTPITITTNTTVKAIAVKSGMSNSAVMSESYTIKQPVATPTANPASGAVASGTTVSLSDGTSGATIYYTTDGTTPTVSSAVYGTTPITITTNTTVKAIAVHSGMTDSGVMSESYTLEPAVSTPTASPSSGVVTYGTTVGLSTTTPGATIYYTTDGSTPTVSSAVYGTTSITLTTDKTVKAIAVKSGMSNSGEMSESYTVPPFQVTYTGDLLGQSILKVTFNQSVDPTTGSDTLNYTVTKGMGFGVSVYTVYSAVVSGNQVTLTVDPLNLSSSDVINLLVSGVKVSTNTINSSEQYTQP